MRHYLRNLTIGKKLTLIVMLTSGVAMLLTSLGFIAYERFSFRKSLVGDIMTTAEIMGDNTSAALSFGDPESAEDTLKSLAAKPQIVAAALYDKDDRLFGIYRRDGNAAAREFLPPAVEPDAQRFGENSLEVFHSIDLAGEKAGTIYIHSTLDEMRERLWRYGLIMLWVMMLAALIAFLLATRLKHVIADPISHLAAVVGLVSVGKNYSVRAVGTGDDELGRLITGFNEMLDQIQARDTALEDARNSLEQRVIERTSELQMEIAEREHAELALRGSEERFSSAFEYASIGMVLVAPDGRLLKVNRALSDLLGYSPAELLTKTFQDITYPDDLPADLENVRRILAGELASYQMEKRYLHKLGHNIWVSLSVSLVRDAAQQPVHFISQVQDISKRKDTEEALAQTHKQLLDASRQSGMAEVATNVLHNVGNVLNSVNVSATLAVDAVRSTRMSNLVKVAALLREHQSSLDAFIAGEQGRHIPNYLEQLAQEWKDQQRAVIQELGVLRGHIDHIKKIVEMQQNYAKISGLTEIANVHELAEDSIRITEDALSKHRVQVIRQFEAAAVTLSVDKHKVLQILVNLIRNAMQACGDLADDRRCITLSVAQVGYCICMSVSDKGTGIAPENLTRIFSHGFTTRKDGHGFGLHSGALAATELGGRLYAHSDGPDQGATFTLELPMRS
jgi:PAS domain S-box-containing protein